MAGQDINSIGGGGDYPPSQLGSTDANLSSSPYPTFGSVGDTPDAVIAAARPEWQYGLLAAIIQPLVDQAVAMTDDEHTQVVSIIAPLIKYGQLCIRRQNKWLSQIINALLMEARSQVGMQSSSLSDIQTIVDQYIQSQPTMAGQGGQQPFSVPGLSSGDRPVPPGQPPTVPSVSGQTPIIQTPTGIVSQGSSPIASVTSSPGVPGQTGPVYSVQFNPGLPSQSLPSVPTVQQGTIGPGQINPPGAGQTGAVGGPGGQSGAGGGSGGVYPSPAPVVAGNVPGCPPGPVTVNVYVPPCPTGASSDTGQGKGTTGAEEPTLEPPGGPVFEPEKTPLVAAPGPEGGDVKTEDIIILPATLPGVTDWDATPGNVLATIDRWLQPLAKLGNAAIEITKDAGLRMAGKLLEWGAIVIVRREIVTGKDIPFDLLEPDLIKRAVSVSAGILRGQFEAYNLPFVGAMLVRQWIDIAESVGVSGINPYVAGNVSINLTIKWEKLKQVIDYLLSYLAPVNVPDQATAMSLFLTNQISGKDYAAYSNLNGTATSLGTYEAIANRVKPDPTTLVKEWQRYYRPIDTLIADLRGQGWLNEDEAKRFATMQEFLPGVSDLISFVTKEVFSPRDFGNDAMTAEWEEQVGVKELMRANGVVPLSFGPQDAGPLQRLIAQFGKDVPTLKDKGNGQIEFDVPFAYWQAHYIHASPTQAYEMLHRLRPDRVNQYPLKDDKGNVKFPPPFTIDDLRLLLRVTDYHPLWRDRLAAISYKSLGRIDIRRMYPSGVFGEPGGNAGIKRDGQGNPVAAGKAEREVVELFKDQGYSERDAQRQAAFLADDYDTKDLKATRDAAKKAACKAYQMGIINDEQFVVFLQRASVEAKDITVLLTTCQHDLDVKVADEGIKAVKKMYLRGIVDAPGAMGHLALIGVIPQGQQRYLQLWSIELKARNKEIGASQMCSWYQDGLITIEEMSVRLLNMGYIPIDIDRIIKHCRIGIAAKGSKEQAAKRRAAAAEFRKSLSARTEGHMIDWYRKGLLNQEEIRSTLLVKGWQPTDIERWIRANIDETYQYTQKQLKGDKGESQAKTKPPTLPK